MDEKLAILKMVEEGKITVEEASKLLEAVGSKKEELSLVPASNKTTEAKWIRIRIYDPEDKAKVNVNVPIALVNVAFKIAKASDKDFDMKIGEMNIDVNDIIRMIQEGAEGKIVDIETEKGEKVEIVIE